MQFLVLVNFGASNAAGINIGLIATLWSLNPFFVSLFEYLFFRHSLSGKQFCGMLLILLCAVFLGLSKAFLDYKDV